MTFYLNSSLPKEKVVQRLQSLMRSEHVSFIVNGNNIISTSIPLPILSIDKRLYSKNNWIGINPFVVLSSIVFTIQETTEIKIHVTINKTRSYVIYSLIVFLVGFVSAAIPNFYFGICFFIFFSIVSWLILFQLYIYLITKEISKSIGIIGDTKKGGQTEPPPI